MERERPLAHAAFNAAPSVGDGPYTFVSWRRGDALHLCRERRYTGAARLRYAAWTFASLRIHPANLLMLQSGSLDWNLIAPVQYAIVAGKPNLAFETVPTAVVAGLALNTRRPFLRRRRACDERSQCRVDRRGISAKITLGKVSRHRYAAAAILVGVRPVGSRAATTTRASADSIFDAAGWRRGPDGMRRRHGVPLHLVYVQFPESMTGVRVATTVQAELRQRGIDVAIKSVSNAQFFLPQNGALAKGDFDLAYVPWTMGADPDDSAVLELRWARRTTCGGAIARVDALERAALTATSQSDRKTLYARIARIVAQRVPIVYLFNADYIYVHRTQLRGFAPNAFLPTWNAYAWKVR